ncbi:MAG TPA: hypothetical protein VKY92_25105 [Verrucomicrobiae bacterium]|nr:hypothetical protein [Verrucomicrobiae bacterium]
MISRICICCGEPFSIRNYEERPNPNICAACSRMMEDDEQESSFNTPIEVVQALEPIETPETVQNAS